MATSPDSIEIYCLKCRAKTGSRDVETVTIKNGWPALRTAAWYDKPSQTSVDAFALVRRHQWLAAEGFPLSAAHPDVQELPTSLYHRMVDSLAYAA